ncbi:MAG TPA: complex I NDUFA9 subunit family protein [Rhizomicrobium sp.]|jgi:NADH dehydrogenase|nr:complex I NDUFA9 subunit family protein [Rhizomicrobium sp.]
MKLVTVFGGSGFLGRYTVRALARAGHRIRVAVRRPHLANFLLPMGHVGQIQIVYCDIADATTVARALRGADAAVNLVGILYESASQRFQKLHADAAETIAQTARAEGTGAVVHVSAIGAERNSDAIYARTKADGERRLRKIFPEAAILRPSIVFGPEDHFFNRFAALARISPALPLIGGGHTKFQPVYVVDVAAAILCCIGNAATGGRNYELGGPRVYTFRELMQLVLAETNRRRLLLPIPWGMAMLQAAIVGTLPNPMLTRDQVRLLRRDNVVSPDALTFADLAIEPEPVEAIIPTYLWRFRREGQFEAPPRLPASAPR